MITITTLSLPPNMQAVKVELEARGPNNPSAYGVERADIEPYFTFYSNNGKPIGFALPKALEKMPGKRMNLHSDINKLNTFDMPGRFVGGLQGAVEALSMNGFHVFISPDVEEMLNEKGEAAWKPFTGEME